MLIAQITDTHVTIDGRQARDLRAALAFINALRPRPEVVLLSGDTANNGHPEQYERLRGMLAESAIGVFLVPGNHDRRPALRAQLPPAHYPGCAGESLAYALDAFAVRIIGLDTTAPGRPGGILDDAQLAWLDGVLGDQPQRPTLIFMHHPPFRTGVNLADIFGFHGRRTFATIVARHPQIRRIIAGHVHCERQTTIAQAVVTTALSTTPQLVPEVFERRLVGLRPEPRGVTVHAWQNDAFITTSYVGTAGGAFTER